MTFEIDFLIFQLTNFINKFSYILKLLEEENFTISLDRFDLLRQVAQRRNSHLT